jgi:hypothetical protein
MVAVIFNLSNCVCLIPFKIFDPQTTKTCHHHEDDARDLSMTPIMRPVPLRMKCTARKLQQTLLLLIGIAFLSPLLWMHRVDLPCTFLTSLPDAAANNTLEETLQKQVVNDPVSEKTTRFLNESAMCQSLASTSAMALWVDNIDKIHDASRLRLDRKWKLHDLTAQVLQLITPRLPLSVKTLPRDVVGVEALLRKAHVRYEYLHAPVRRRRGLPVPPPVKIVVLGGSVTAGVNCYSGIGGSDLDKCAWSARMKGLINNMAQGELVEVHVFALGGSNTNTATVLLEYDLLPKEAQNADIMINGYSTNDMHVKTIEEAAGEGKTLTDKVFEMCQDFVRVALRPRPCQKHPPLLLWLDDYLGNEQRVILETTALSKAMHVLANYYGFGSVSHADAVSDWVYGDTREYLFSPNWYKGKGFTREIHPGQGAHLSMAWMMTYHLLTVATNYCSLEAWNVAQGEASMSYNHSKIPGLPELLGVNQVGANLDKAKPKPKPGGLPPALTNSLSIRGVSKDWRDADAATASTLEQCKDKDYKQCPFAWIVGFPLDGGKVELYQKKSESDTTLIHDYFAKHVTNFGGWEVVDDTGRGKYGWVPVNGKVGSQMTLEFSKLSQAIRTVTFFTMKSYGEKWANSTARIDISSKSSKSGSDWKALTSKDMVGFHDKHTSEMYTEPMRLPTDVQPGDNLRISITFLSGSTFKIQGLAVCS